MRGQIEGGRELWFDYKWGKIKTTFLPYSVTASPANIRIEIGYKTYLFEPEDERMDDETLYKLMGWD